MDGIDLWETQPDHNRDRDWTCRARGATMGGNIIDRVAVSLKGFSDGEIHTALKDFIPGTDHRAVLTLINVEPSARLMDQHVIFMTRDVTRPKPRIRYPTKTEKHRFDDFQAAVDKMAQEQNLAEQLVIDSVSFITRYERLMSIFGKCASMIFGHNKPYRGNSGWSLTLGPI
jgi:hypothetical protein